MCLAAVVLGTAVQPLRPILVQGVSMAPTYADGCVLWTTPVDRPLRRGDVVVVDTPEGRLIKRVALLPGDRRFQWKGPGEWIDLITTCASRSNRTHLRFRMATVPPGTVFLLGDNLDWSIDSRNFGPVPIADVRRMVIDRRDPDERAGVRSLPPRKWLALGVDPTRERKG